MAEDSAGHISTSSCELGIWQLEELINGRRLTLAMNSAKDCFSVADWVIEGPGWALSMDASTVSSDVTSPSVVIVITSSTSPSLSSEISVVVMTSGRETSETY